MEQELIPVEHHNQRILTTQQVAEAYGTDSKTISYNFNNNKSRYTLGKHYYALEGEEKLQFLANHLEFHDGLRNAKVLYLWTEKGALMHAKSLNTDKAWEAYELLVDEYYRQKEQLTALPIDPAARLTEIDERIERVRVLAQGGKGLQGVDTVIASIALFHLVHTTYDLERLMRKVETKLKKQPDRPPVGIGDLQSLKKLMSQIDIRTKQLAHQVELEEATDEALLLLFSEWHTHKGAIVNTEVLRQLSSVTSIRNG